MEQLNNRWYQRPEQAHVMPYTTQCAFPIAKVLGQYDVKIRQMLHDYTQNPEAITLEALSAKVEEMPFDMIVGEDLANPGFPQTLSNLKQWQHKSALGMIYREAESLVAESEKMVAVFARTKDKENIVMHEGSLMRAKDDPAIVGRFVSMLRGTYIIVEQRRSFVELLLARLREMNPEVYDRKIGQRTLLRN